MTDKIKNHESLAMRLFGVEKKQTSAQKWRAAIAFVFALSFVITIYIGVLIYVVEHIPVIGIFMVVFLIAVCVLGAFGLFDGVEKDDEDIS